MPLLSCLQLCVDAGGGDKQQKRHLPNMMRQPRGLEKTFIKRQRTAALRDEARPYYIIGPLCLHRDKTFTKRKCIAALRVRGRPYHTNDAHHKSVLCYTEAIRVHSASAITRGLLNTSTLSPPEGKGAALPHQWRIPRVFSCEVANGFHSASVGGSSWVGISWFGNDETLVALYRNGAALLMMTGAYERHGC
mmetsp:Transcript_43905/g.93407  ORF Transcript_43905/g.93407 Transcript_43905/m.93407 type:complete len:192 (-) Transcript_43905:1166-1741(-)